MDDISSLYVDYWRLTISAEESIVLTATSSIAGGLALVLYGESGEVVETTEPVGDSYYSPQLALPDLPRGTHVIGVRAHFAGMAGGPYSLDIQRHE